MSESDLEVVTRLNYCEAAYLAANRRGAAIQGQQLRRGHVERRARARQGSIPVCTGNHPRAQARWRSSVLRAVSATHARLSASLLQHDEFGATEPVRAAHRSAQARSPRFSAANLVADMDAE